MSTKSDLDLVEQRFDMQPEVFVRETLKNPIGPLSISIKTGITADVYFILAKCALQSSKNTKDIITKRSAGQTWITIGVMSSLVVVGAIGLRYYFQSSRT